jgi:hypothetical protein
VLLLRSNTPPQANTLNNCRLSHPKPVVRYAPQ